MTEKSHLSPLTHHQQSCLGGFWTPVVAVFGVCVVFLGSSGAVWAGETALLTEVGGSQGKTNQKIHSVQKKATSPNQSTTQNSGGEAENGDSGECLPCAAAQKIVQKTNALQKKALSPFQPTTDTPVIWLDETVAPTVAVREINALELIRATLQAAQKEGVLAAKRQQTKEGLRRHLAEPAKLALTRYEGPDVPEERTVLLVGAQSMPSSAALKDAIERLKRTYIFVDATDAAQCRWVQQELIQPSQVPVRVVTVAGSPTLLSERLGVQVWSDQGGVLSRRFFLTNVPSRVTVEGGPMGVTARVTTVVLHESGSNSDAEGRP